jgi:hypothetical protein
MCENEDMRSLIPLVIGEILDRPSLVDSHGLSTESRRLSKSPRRVSTDGSV